MTAQLTPEQQQAWYDAEFENIGKYSGKVSELLKFLWAGSLATFFALLLAEPTTAGHAYLVANETYVKAAAAAGGCSLIAEYLQYICGYFHAKRITTWIPSKNSIAPEEQAKQTSTWQVKANIFFFWSKNLLGLCTGILMILPIVLLWW